MHYLNYLLISLGGAFGALSRYYVSTWVYNKSQTVFPVGTFVVNIAGCFLLGAFYALTLKTSIIPSHFRMMISVGFLGAFTTFSTFSLETMIIIKENNLLIALMNIGLSVLLGLVAVWLGISLMDFFYKSKERSVKES